MKKNLMGLFLVLLFVPMGWAETGGGKTQGIPAPGAGHGMVVVLREMGLRPDLAFHVYLDEAVAKERLGYTLGGQFIYFQVPVGKHEVVSVGENTKTIALDIKAGETLYIQQNEQLDPRDGSNQGPMKILTPEAGQYALKHAVKGRIDER